MKCNSCDKDTSEGVMFKCSTCGEEIFRCIRCRTLSIDYRCVKCGKVGP